MSHKFEILKDVRRESRCFITVGTQLTVRPNPPSEPDTTPVDHFLASVNDLIEHAALQDVGDADMVGIAIHNEINQHGRPIGISFRRRDQLSGDVFWRVFEKVVQSNARLNTLDTLTVLVHSVRMPVGFGCFKNKGRPRPVMNHLKRSIPEIKAQTNCLAHALITAIANATNDPNYKAYGRGWKIHSVVQTLLETTGIDLTIGPGITELERLQTLFREYTIVVY
jgi:hypothetical protein